MSLRAEVGSMAIDLASKVVSESLKDSATASRVVDQFLKDIETSKAGN
jgi:F-type H+-transporting ATPase subunit b